MNEPRVNQAVIAAASLLVAASPAFGAEAAGEVSTEELAKTAQNPVAKIISVPFQNNTNFGYGLDGDQTQNVLNIQPVVPFTLTPQWILITRTVVPLVWQPSFTGGGTTFGLGNVNTTLFLSPSAPGTFKWGIGPMVSFPSATSPRTGSQSTWGLGPSLVVLATPGPWVVGVLANDVWSVAGTTSNTMLIQPFVNYNFGGSGWYLATSPVITADWEAPSGQQWIVPFGGGVGKLVRLGKLPINMSVSAYYNAVKPDIGPEWTLRAQATILLPASIFM